tara:strand:- start:38186 stop:39169 length:984 start_codon:yes stop_codon:yes gene_type:complete
MSFDNLTIKKVDNLDAWDKFVEESEDGTIFSTIAYLNLSQSKYHLWWILSGDVIRAGLCFVVSEDGNQIISDDLVVYSGLIFSLDSKAQEAKKFNRRYIITEFIAKQIRQMYTNINFSFAPEINDPRPFQFYGYGVVNKKKYKCESKFTSYVNINDLLRGKASEFESNSFNNMRPVKRRDIRFAKEEGYNVVQETSCDIFLDFHKKNLKNQHINITEYTINKLNNLICGLLDNKKASVMTINDKDSRPIYSIVYAWDNKKAYYLFGAGTLINPKHWQGVVAQWEGFKYIALNTNLNTIDLEGVNSPARGSFKMSLGGFIVPYYNISL